MNDRIVIHPPKKQKDGTFTVTVSYYVDNIRKQKRKSKIATSKLAKIAGEDIKKKLEEDLVVIKATGGTAPTLKDFSDQYFEIKKRNWAFSTVEVKKAALALCDFINKPLDQVTQLDIDMNISRLLETHAFGTVDTMVASWNVFLNAAVAYNYIKKNPYKRGVLVKPKGTQDRVKALTITEADVLYEKIDRADMKLITLIGYTCGLRKGEILDLNLKDFDFKKGTLKVSHQYSRTVEGKKREQPLKTDNSYRTISPPPRTMEAVRSFKVVDMHGYVFTQELANIGNTLSEEYTRLGYPDVTLHTMRHTFVTHLIRSRKFDLQSIANLAGDTVKTILDTYSHYLDEVAEENAQKLAELFG